MANRRELLDQFGERIFSRLQRAFVKKDAVAAERAGERLGLFLYRIDKKHRERTYANLAFALPEIDEEKRKQIAREMYLHFGRVAGDFLRSPARTPDETMASVEVQGVENLEAAEAMGKGVLAITGHFGNWERFAQYMTATGRNVSVVARDANQSGVNAEVTKTREAMGVRVLSRGESAREILVRLKTRELIGILADQNADDVFVPFFGKMCGNVLGPAKLHQRTGAALLPCYCVRIGPAKYRLIFNPVIDPENIEKDAARLTSLLNDDLEKMIRQYPEQWLWMHDRWKEARRRGMI